MSEWKMTPTVPTPELKASIYAALQKEARKARYRRYLTIACAVSAVVGAAVALLGY